MSLSIEAKKQMLAHLYSEEDYRQFPYDDATGLTVKAPEGHLTFGIGWNIEINGCPKPIAEFAAMYFVDMIDKELSEKVSFYEDLDEPTKVALCDMAFNMGVEGLMKFDHMLDAIHRDDRSTAAICMLNSKWANQVGNRSVILSHMVESKQWVSK